MRTFVRAVITGFGLSLGSAVYKRVSKKLGFDDKDDKDEDCRDRGAKVDPEQVVSPVDDATADADEDAELVAGGNEETGQVLS